jgi:hypothetical protein
MKSRKKITTAALAAAIGIALTLSNAAAAKPASPSYPPIAPISEAVGIAPSSMPKPAVNVPYTDPAFGTQMVRISDSEADRAKMKIGGAEANVHVLYAYYPTFNVDSTRMLVGTSQAGHAGIYNFDPDTMQAEYFSDLYNYESGYRFNEAIAPEGAYWSATDPDVLYGIKQYNYEAQIVAMNVVTKESVVIKNFVADGDLPEGYARQLSKSFVDDRYFAFHWIPDQGHDLNLYDNKNMVRKAVVYDRLTDTTYIWDMEEMGYDPSQWRLDEVRLDHKGKILHIFMYKEVGDVQAVIFWDFANQAPEDAIFINDGFEERGGGHYDMGTDIQVQMDRWGNTGFQVIKRELADPKQWTIIATSPVEDWQSSAHISATGPDDSWALVSTYTGLESPDYSAPFTNELVLVRTDGSGDILRLAHTYGTQPGWSYLHSPFGNISPDGRFFAFSSNWMNGSPGEGTLDVYVGRIPEGIWAGYVDRLPAQLVKAYEDGKIADRKTLDKMLSKLSKPNLNAFINSFKNSKSVDAAFMQTLTENLLTWMKLYQNGG